MMVSPSGYRSRKDFVGSTSLVRCIDYNLLGGSHYWNCRFGRRSRLGSAKVSLELFDSGSLLVSGLLGKVEQELPCGRGGVRVFPSKGEFGGFLGRLSRIVFGVSEGFREEVELRGLGYRGFVATDGLYLDLGDCHWVVIQVPAAVELRFQGRYHVLLQSYDYCVLRNFLDNLERVSRVNVYTGLGLRVGAKPYRVKIGKIREK